MKILLLCGFMFLLHTTSLAQSEQENTYRFGFIFKKRKLESGGVLHVSKDTTLTTLDTIGCCAQGNGSLYLTKSRAYTVKIDSIKQIAGSLHGGIGKRAGKLKGVITERNGDTLFINFWDITPPDPFSGTNPYVNILHNGESFYYVITNWRRRSFFSGRYYDIPFTFKQFMATSLPFRILTKNGDLESDFLNANIAFMFIRGATRLFKSEFVEPRNRHLGIGPYFGLSSIDINNEDKEFGINYGINLVGALENVHFTIAYGFQNGFDQAKKVQSYVGFGIGVSLFETFKPEISKKD